MHLDFLSCGGNIYLIMIKETRLQQKTNGMRPVQLHKGRPMKLLASIILYFYKDHLKEWYFYWLKFHFLFPGAQVLKVSHLDSNCPLTLILSSFPPLWQLNHGSPVSRTPCGVQTQSPTYLMSSLISQWRPTARKLWFPRIHSILKFCIYTSTHIYPHTYICANLHPHMYTECWHKSAAAGYHRPFPCTEIPFPSLDPAQSCLLDRNLTKFPKTKPWGNKWWR